MLNVTESTDDIIETLGCEDGKVKAAQTFLNPVRRSNIVNTMALSSTSPRGITTDYISSEGGLREDFPVEDEYIYDDYDSEPLLSSQGHLELSRHYQGRKYSLLRRDEADANTIIPMRCRSRRCALKIFIILILCGVGGLCGYFITVKYIHTCNDVLLAASDLNSVHKHFINRISSKSIEKFLR